MQRVKELHDELRATTRDRDQKKAALNEQQMERELMQTAVSVKLHATLGKENEG